MSTTSRKRAFSGISSVEKAIDKLSKISSENKDTDNEFDYFGKNLAVQLKNMPIDRALICQEKLQKVINEERMFQFTQQTLMNNATNRHIDMSIGWDHYPSVSPIISENTSSSTTSFSETNCILSQALCTAMNET